MSCIYFGCSPACLWNKNSIQLIHAMLSLLIQFIYKNKKQKKKPCYPFYLHCNTCKGLYALNFFFLFFFFFDTHNNRGWGKWNSTVNTMKRRLFELSHQSVVYPCLHGFFPYKLYIKLVQCTCIIMYPIWFSLNFLFLEFCIYKKYL